MVHEYCHLIWIACIHNTFLQDVTVNVLLAIFFLSGAAASASRCFDWSKPPYVCREAGRSLVNTITTNSFYCEEDVLTVCLAVLSVRLY